ncbi:MAG: hypothetical protein ACU0A6_04945 [Shimia sp.]|jgi:two-component system cell cycle response regulator|uniref:hypothetical protein n=1 Tax=Shimia sp. TaxID=1954381 RepID=UPI0040593C72
MPSYLLIVDSIAANRCVIKAKLADSYLEVRQAETGQDALEMMRVDPPDLVVLG